MLVCKTRIIPPIIEILLFPVLKDRHVPAAAVKTNANLIRYTKSA